METKPTMPERDQCVVGALLEKWSIERPDDVFLLFEDDSSWTFAETLDYTRRAAAGLHDLGVDYGSHVLCWLPNSKETILTWFGANYLGATFVPVNTAYRGHMLEHVIALSDAKVLVAHADLLTRMDDIDTATMKLHLEASYPIEPVHPSEFGHKVMAEVFLQALGSDSDPDLIGTGIDSRVNDPYWRALLELVRQQRETYDRSLLNDIGHGNPRVMESFTTPLSDVEQRVRRIDSEIEELRREALDYDF